MSDRFFPVQPHGGIEKIIDDAWYVTGSVVMKPLVRLARNMIILRHEGELTLVNSVRLNADGEAALDALGRIAHVMKIGVHGMDDAYYCDRYGARYWLPEGASSDPIGAENGVLTEGALLPIPNSRVFRFQETATPEVALLVERQGGLLITCDSVQHWVPHGIMSPLARFLTWVMGFRKPAQIGPPWRKRQTRPGGSLRPDFERMAALPFERLIGGHGGLLERDAQQHLRVTIERELG